MNLSPKRISKYRENAKLYRLPDREKNYPAFVPNPGGQENLFANYLTLETTYNYPYRWILISGGINSGKSTCAAAFICAQARLDPESRILITANTYGQLETSTLVALAEYCDRFGYSLQPSGGSVEETARKIAKNRYCRIEGAYCFVLSAENFTGRTERSKQSGRGLQIRLIWADEFTYAEKTAFEAIDGRLGRGAGKIKGIGIISSTINRNNPYNWAYDLFHSPDRSPDQKRLYGAITIPTQENIYADNDFILSQQANLTDELIALELLGQYVSISEGRVFPYFRRSDHVVSLDHFEESPFYLSFDFNWSPATCLVCQIRGEKLLIFKEFYLLNSNTFELADKVCSYVSGYNLKCYIYGDASGMQRTANSKQTNWAIVWDYLDKYQIKAVRRYEKANPSIIDSVNSVNCLLDRDRLIVSDRCKQLIKDLEFLIWHKDKIDKSDNKRSHLGDCLRYLVHSEFPYNGKPNWTSKARVFYG